MFNNKLFGPIGTFLQYLQNSGSMNKIMLENLFFTPEDPLIEILQKFVYTNGQVVWVDAENTFVGLFSLHDVFNLFI
jgi:hypothetical protein